MLKNSQVFTVIGNNIFSILYLHIYDILCVENYNKTTILDRIQSQNVIELVASRRLGYISMAWDRILDIKI